MTRRVLGGALIVALAIVGVTAAMLWRLEQGQLAGGLDNVSALDLLVGAQTERAFDNVNVVLEGISADLQAEGVATAAALRQAVGGEASYRLLRAKMAGVPQLDSLVIATSAGDVVNGTRSYPASPDAGLADRDYFIRLRDHPELTAYVSPPLLNSDGKPMIYVGKRLNAPNGAFIGVVVGTVPVQYFDHLYANYLQTLPGDAKSVALWRDDGTLLSRTPGAADPGSDAASPDLAQPMPGSGLLAYWATDPRGGSVAVAQRRFENLPLAIEVRQSASALVGARSDEFLATGLGGGALLLLVGAAVWMLLRQLRAETLVSEERARANREAEAREEIEGARTEAEAAMRDAQHSEARFRDIAEVGSDWIWETDAEHRFTMIAGARQPKVSIMGKTRWEQAGVDPATDALWREHKALLDAHQPFRQFRFALELPNGRFHVCVSGKPIFADDGSFIGYRGTVSDETELVTTRERAARADALLRHAIDSIAEGFVIFDGEDRFVMCNEAYRKMYPENSAGFMPGTSYEEIMRAAVATGRYPDAIGREEEWLAEHLRQHKDASGVEENQLSDGRWVLRSERRMPDGGIAGLRIDITALKHAQESLRDSEVILNRAQRLSGTGSVVRNLKTKVTEWSDEMYRLFGVTRESFEPATEKFLAMIHPEDRGMVAEAIANGMHAVAEPAMEFRIIRPDGTLRWVYREADFWCDPDGTPAQRLTTYKDITEQRAAEMRHRELEALLRDAIESISEGFVIYDKDDRLVICNEAFHRLYPNSAERMVPGARYEDILRAAAYQNRAVPREDAEEWLATRLRQHREPREPVEVQLEDGRWVLISERRTSSGGTAGLRFDITALKRTQQSLRDSQAALARAQRVAKTGSIVRDLVTGNVEWSDEMFRLFGVSPETFPAIPESFLALAHPADRDKLAAAIDAGARGETTPPLEYRAILPDDTERWFHRESEVLCDAEGKPTALIGTFTDITERREAELRQGELETLLHDAIESISAGFVIYDAADRLVICNETYRRIYADVADLLVPGVHFADVLRAQLARHQWPELKDREEEWIADSLRKRRALAGPIETQMGDRWILVSERPMSNGQLAGLHVDITEMKQVQQSLRESEERFNRTQRIAHIGTVERDLRTREVVWSDETFRIFGVTRESYKPSFDNLMALVHPEDRELMVAAYRRNDRQHANTALKFRIRRPDGETRAILSQADTVYAKDGTPTHVSIAMMDVTDKEVSHQRQRELETQLRHSEKLTALGTLAGGIAHDINNTLVPIQALSKLVMKEFPPDAPARADIEMIHQASIQARDLVRQILTFSRKEELLEEPTDITARVQEALQMLRASVPSTIEIVGHIATVAPMLADGTQLQQVIVNLVANAAHAIGSECGRVTVALDDVPGEPGTPRAIRLSVADNGCGMSSEIMQRMFEPFFTTKSVGEGTGLGLSVVHGIVTSHGGTIDVRSMPGEGTEFIILLPARSIDEGSAIADVA